jgi:hypothetical protein
LGTALPCRAGLGVAESPRTRICDAPKPEELGTRDFWLQSLSARHLPGFRGLLCRGLLPEQDVASGQPAAVARCGKRAARGEANLLPNRKHRPPTIAHDHRAVGRHSNRRVQR